MLRRFKILALTVGFLFACTPTQPTEVSSPDELAGMASRLAGAEISLPWYGHDFMPYCDPNNNYACYNNPDWNNGIRTFQDFVPPGYRVVGIEVNVSYGTRNLYFSPAATLLLNGQVLGTLPNTASNYLCRDNYPVTQTASIELPQYIYGGINTLQVVPTRQLSGAQAVCVSKTDVILMLKPGPSRIALGALFSLAIKPDRSVWGWGDNRDGQLGDGTSTPHSTPTHLSSPSIAQELAAGDHHSLALMPDGTVWAWGSNTSGELGDGTTAAHLAPTQLPSLNGVTAIAVGRAHSLALKSDGTVWAWGSNAFGQLGDGTTTDHLTPTQVPNLNKITAIAAGHFHSMALKSDGTVWMWGVNDSGQLGDGTTTSRMSPQQVPGLMNVKAIAAGEAHSLAALYNSGNVMAWGDNSLGELGDGTQTSRYAPVPVSVITDVEAVAAGVGHSLAVKSDGTVWAWGDNNYGQLGTGQGAFALTPTQVPTLSNVLTIGAGYWHSAAIKSDGTLWAWGSNDYGQVGDGTSSYRVFPVQIY